jgi:hypothetical protein
MIALIDVLSMPRELIVEQDSETTQSLCPCDHAIKYASSYLPKKLS